MENIIIKSVGGVCGSGKTKGALQHAVNMAKIGLPTIIAQPTCNLTDASVERIKAIDPNVPVYAITSRSFPDDVIMKRFLSHMESYGGGGQIVLVTHKTFLDAPIIDNRSAFRLIIDEVPSVEKSASYNLTTTWKYILQSLDVEEFNDNIYLKLIAKDAGAVGDWARNRDGDDVVETVRPLFEIVAMKHWTAYITRENWFRVTSNEGGPLHVHGVLSPDVVRGFDGVTIMGANFDHSFLKHIWTQLPYEVKFEDNTDICDPAAQHDPKVGSRATIHYFSERSWSKNLRNRLGGVGWSADADQLLKTMDTLLPVLDDLFGEEKYLWVANNDIMDAAVPGQNAQRISNVSHGDNRWRSWNNIAFLSAIQDQPAHAAFLEHMFCINEQDRYQARCWEVAYQCIMRTSLRDADATEPVKIIVPDRNLAEYLRRHLLPGSTVATCGDDLSEQVVGNAKKSLGRPIKESKLTPTERNAKRVAKAKELMITKSTIKDMLFVTGNRDAYPLSFENSVASTDFISYKMGSINQFRSLLRSSWDIKYRTKDENLLVSPATFDPNACEETNKGKANVIGVSAMMLDIDGGLLCYREMSRILYDVKHLIYNSFNNGVDGKMKYRVVIPFNRIARLDEDHHIWDLIADRIRSAGYRVGSYPKHGKESGLDTSKRVGCSWFYMPCRANRGMEYTFWEEHWDGIQQLDVDSWIKRPLTVKPEYEYVSYVDVDRSAADENGHTSVVETSVVDMTFVDNAEAEWATTPKGQGHAAFYKLTLRYASAGLDEYEMRTRLQRQAPIGQSPADRRSEIGTNIRNALRHVRRAA